MHLSRPHAHCPLKPQRVTTAPSGQNWELQQALIEAHWAKNHGAPCWLFEYFALSGGAEDRTANDRVARVVTFTPNCGSLKLHVFFFICITFQIIQMINYYLKTPNKY